MFDVATMFMLVRIAFVGVLLWMFYRAVHSGIARIRSGGGEQTKYLSVKLSNSIILLLLFWPFSSTFYQRKSIFTSTSSISNFPFKQLVTRAIAISILTLMAGCQPSLQQLEQQNLDTLYHIAETVGYTPEALVVQSSNCWDPSLLPPYTKECAIFLIFTADATIDETQMMIENLNYQEIYNRSTSITRLARLIHYDTPKTLYLDGIDANNQENDANRQTISGHYWFLRDEQDRFVDIYLFLTADTSGRLAIDDMPVEQNLLLVHLALGRVYP